ncbi:MAG: hypothetical protein MJ078_04740 [Clostridia bacterium]|nr:hypothetical protein [Clostridia bacterium]
MPVQNQGFLSFFVTTAGQSLPLADARIAVSGEKSDTYVLYSDPGGKTVPIALNAPSPDLSLSAGQKTPFYSYNVRVSKKGFYDILIYNIPVFPGIYSVQPVELLGVSAFGTESDRFPLSVDQTPDRSPQALNRN